MTQSRLEHQNVKVKQLDRRLSIRPHRDSRVPTGVRVDKE